MYCENFAVADMVHVRPESSTASAGGRGPDQDPDPAWNDLQNPDQSSIAAPIL